MGEFLDVANAVTGSKAELVWKEAGVVVGKGVRPWTEMPCWLPPGEKRDFVFKCNVEKAFAAGLVSRKVEDTVGDTWAWMEKQDGEIPTDGKLGIDPEKEVAALNGEG
jgi:2'-hydroxyisoflavone reductase